MTLYPTADPAAVQFLDQMTTLLATSGRVHTTHELTQLAPARVISGPCAWGTCLPRGERTPGVVAEWHDRDTGTHFVHVERTSREVDDVLGYLVAIGHVKLITVSAPLQTMPNATYKAWLWTGPVPVSAARLETMWSLT